MRCTERNGATLLIAAVAGGQDPQEAIVWMLLERGASVDEGDTRRGTALIALL